MLIKDLKDKQTHPIAAKIPDNLWQELFPGGIEETDMQWVDKPFAEIERLNLPKDRMQAFILMLIYYPNIEPNDHIAYSKNTLQLEPEKIFKISAAMGLLNILKSLIEQNPNQLQALIQWDEYIAFRNAAENGHIDILNWLKEQAPDELRKMIQAAKYDAFKSAAGEDELEVLIWLKEQALDELQDMISSIHYASFRWAARCGHLTTIEWLKEQVSDIRPMIREQSYNAFRYAAEEGHLETLKWFKTHAADELHAMIQARDYYAFVKAMQNNHLDVANWLLLDPQCLAFAEMHIQEYGDRVVKPFISETLRALHQDSESFQINQPNAVFDLLDLEQAQKCFYMIRNIIRRNDRSLDDELRFLLSIPAVKALAHQAVTPDIHNELVRLALTTGNREASEILLDIEAVRTLAEENNFYSREARGAFNLRQLAQDRESSMTALSVGETKRLAEAIKRYQPIIQEQGISQIMASLRENLLERYNQNPATIKTVTGELITLPYDYQAFQDLNLNASDYEAALKAYYQNKDHSAWRYLAKPNLWMHPDAVYVCLDSQNPNHHYANFEDYQSMIAMYYLAALDKGMPPTDGHTLAGRLEHFFDELALIGRAHNWDKTRVKNNKAEEYDDLEGDRPSCFSGVKRRLFQSVLGHPLLKILTKDDLLFEIRTFARDHFLSVLTPENKKALKDAFSDYLTLLDDESAQPLRELNIPEKKVQRFNNYLANNYGAQFSENGAFLSLVRTNLTLSQEPQSKVSDRYHALKLDGLTQLYSYLNESSPTGPSRLGLFAPKEATSPDEAEKPNLKR